MAQTRQDIEKRFSVPLKEAIIDIFDTLLLLSLSLALAVNYHKLYYLNNKFIGSLVASANESDSKSNE